MDTVRASDALSPDADSGKGLEAPEPSAYRRQRTTATPTLILEVSPDKAISGLCRTFGWA